ncbi:metal-dependent hydrolase [Coraliomargarita sinensis]|uniref:Metal-dependent hydrolase n=1 Tax=Coraliomargarita sinensis TaxID=2174842 RepID=A0A317ZKY3_9BACT|nr:metal-dependent hydrolase [Coraliomargarita sinensis]PXA04479.1 metal-dependent hydrolase [Coraliomargarita sinensis]
MDPLTQMSVGAAAAVAVARKPADIRHALVLGALAGGAPDLDVLIRSEEDPLLSLEYHRHFTHALLLAPVIGGLVAMLYKIIFARKMPLRQLVVFGVVATLTHGLIDACTSYGTLLYWPFFNHRESWDIISIIDPIFTLPLVVCLIFAWCRRSHRFARGALLFLCLYLTVGVYQREQAEDYARSLANQRGHTPTELTARPSLGNILLWRLVYRNGDNYHVDGVRTFPGLEDRHYPGATVRAFDELDAYALMDPDSVLWRDIERFRFFSQGYLFLHENSPLVAGDLRYAMYPDSIVPLWGVTIDPSNANTHTQLKYFREVSGGAFNRLWRMIRGLPVAQSSAEASIR